MLFTYIFLHIKYQEVCYYRKCQKLLGTVQTMSGTFKILSLKKLEELN